MQSREKQHAALDKEEWPWQLCKLQTYADCATSRDHLGAEIFAQFC